MCGIVGIFNFNNKEKVDKNMIKHMNNKIKHRGPDSEGFYIKDNIGLGNRRLNIIDLKTGDQPRFCPL